MTKKRKNSLNLVGLQRFESYQTAHCYSQKSFFKNHSQQEQLYTSSGQHTQPLVTNLTKTCLRSEFSSQHLSNINTVHYLDKMMYSYKSTQDFFYHPTKLAIHSFMRREFDFSSNYGHNFKKTVSFVNIVLFTDHENIVTYVAMWNLIAVLLSTLKILQN